MENMKVLAIKINEELQKKIKYHLLENNITLKDYVTELLEADLVKDKELNKQEENIENKTKSNTLEEQKVESKEETRPMIEKEQKEVKSIETLEENKKEELD